MSGPVTLGDLIEAKKLLWVYCCDCGHERDVDPAALPLSWDTPVPFISTHMKCSACGSRKWHRLSRERCSRQDLIGAIGTRMSAMGQKRHRARPYECQLRVRGRP